MACQCKFPTYLDKDTCKEPTSFATKTMYGIVNKVYGNQIHIGQTVLIVKDGNPIPDWIKKGVIIKIETDFNKVTVRPEQTLTIEEIRESVKAKLATPFSDTE